MIFYNSFNYQNPSRFLIFVCLMLSLNYVSPATFSDEVPGDHSTLRSRDLAKTKASTIVICHFPDSGGFQNIEIDAKDVKTYKDQGDLVGGPCETQCVTSKDITVIRAAIDSASNNPNPKGRVVTICPMDIPLDSGVDLSLNNPVTLLCPNPLFCTFYPSVFISGSALTVRQGTLTMNGFLFTGFESGSYPGAVFNVLKGTTLNLKNSEFLYNVAMTYGGAIAASEATVNIDHTFFLNNGDVGINAGGDSGRRTATAVDASTFGRGGSAIFAFASNLVISDCLFSQNQCSSCIGGAILVSQGENTEISQCTFTENTAEHHGGAVFLDESTATIGHTEFRSNYADQGGAVYVGESSTLLLRKGCGFLDNDSRTGAAIFVEGALSRRDINKATYVNNVATVFCNDVYLYSSGLCLP